jgi:hypothetical protein
VALVNACAAISHQLWSVLQMALTVAACALKANTLLVKSQPRRRFNVRKEVLFMMCSFLSRSGKMSCKEDVPAKFKNSL